MSRIRNAGVELTIPVYNEEVVLADSVRSLCRYLSEMGWTSWAILIADNGSMDGTLEIAQRLAREHAEVNWVALEEKGRGRALKKAWRESHADVLCYMDVDLSTDLSGFLPLVTPLLNGEADVAIGSRLLAESVTQRCLKREVISRGYNFLIRRMFKSRISDAQCGFKGMTKEAAKGLLPLIEDNAWFFDTELLLIAEDFGYRIHQIPVRWREDRDSRVRIVKTAMDDIRGLIRLKRRFREGEVRLPYPRQAEAASKPGASGPCR